MIDCLLTYIYECDASIFIQIYQRAFHILDNVGDISFVVP